MNATKTVAKCAVCRCRITQAEADAGAEIVGPGHETMCEACAQSIVNTPCDDEPTAEAE